MDVSTLSKFYIENKEKIDADRHILIELINENLKHEMGQELKILIDYYNCNKEEINKHKSLLIGMLMTFAKWKNQG